MPGPSKPIEIKPCPQIMEELSKFLRDRGHSCVMIIGTTIHKFKWCGQDICPDKLMLDDMHNRDNERTAFAQKLKDAGHTCVYEMESFPVQVGWCGQDICNRQEL